MKRMVKNGNLLDVKPNGDLGIKGNAQVGGRLQVKSSIIANGEIRGGDISGTKFLLGTEEMPLVKANPTGEATETLEKVKIGDVAYNVGGGSDYTAGSNIEISEAKEISVNPQLTGIQKIDLIPNDGCIIWGEQDNLYLESKHKSTTFKFPRLVLKSATPSYKEMIISFNSDTQYYQTINVDSQGSNGSILYAFLTKGEKVPLVPNEDGTYILKATVSGGAVTYTWVKEA